MRQVEIYLNLTLGHAFLNYAEGNEMRCAWRGHLDLPANDDQACHITWAFFQNPLGLMCESQQDKAWIATAQQQTNGYQDRSLSAGDVITIDGESYAVEFIGWRSVEPLSGDPIIGPEGDSRLREQVEDWNNRHGKCPSCGGPLDVSTDGSAIKCMDRMLCGFSQEGHGIRTYVENSSYLEGGAE